MCNRVFFIDYQRVVIAHGLHRFAIGLDQIRFSRLGSLVLKVVLVFFKDAVEIASFVAKTNIFFNMFFGKDRGDCFFKCRAYMSKNFLVFVQFGVKIGHHLIINK
jgi:hypothetical protein